MWTSHTDVLQIHWTHDRSLSISNLVQGCLDVASKITDFHEGPHEERSNLQDDLQLHEKIRRVGLGKAKSGSKGAERRIKNDIL